MAQLKAAPFQDKGIARVFLKPLRRKQGVRYECEFEKIDGLDDCSYPHGDGGTLRRIEVAGSAHSGGCAGVVFGRAPSWNWPELTGRLKIEKCR
jgi:hypothetical protein